MFDRHQIYFSISSDSWKLAFIYKSAGPGSRLRVLYESTTAELPTEQSEWIVVKGLYPRPRLTPDRPRRLADYGDDHGHAATKRRLRRLMASEAADATF